MLPVLSLCALALAPSADDPHAAHAVATTHALDGSEELVVRGTARRFGTDARFELRIRADGSFSRTIDGPLSEVTVYDGESVWRSEDGGPAWELELRARELAHLDVLPWSGAWTAPDGRPARIEEPPRARPEPGDFRVRGGLLTARATFGPESRLLEELAVPGNREGRRWSFEWAELGPGWLPRVARLVTDEGLEERFVVETAELVQATGALEPPALPSPAAFDPDAPAAVDVRRAPTGHLFVRPEVEGEDVGWFLFDSGAGGTLIDAETADRLGLETFGETRLTGFGPDVHATRFRRIARLVIGPLALRDLVAVERAGPSMASRILGEPVVGVLGWDVFLRSVVVIDSEAGRLEIHDPREYDATGVDWQPLTLHHRVPYVTATFEGERSGLFCLDTGAGAKTVLFHADAVERLGLLGDRSTTEVRGGGAGGGVTLRRGRLAWFELSGVRHEPATALFSTGDDGEADPYTLGFLGAGFLGDVEVVLDYGRGRVGFVARGSGR